MSQSNRTAERILVISLRCKQHLSAPTIAKESKVPLGTVRKWIKPFPLTPKQHRQNLIVANRSKPPRARMTKEEERKRNREFNRLWYQKTKDSVKLRVRNRKRELGEYIDGVKTSRGCCQCGENNPACLDFHHRKTYDKSINVALMPLRGMSKARIDAEIEKCDVICSNCHRKLHWEERNAGETQSD